MDVVIVEMLEKLECIVIVCFVWIVLDELVELDYMVGEGLGGVIKVNEYVE